MGVLNSPLTGNVTEAGDIVLLAIVLVTTFVVGLALFGIDTAVGRLRSRHSQRRDSTRRLRKRRPTSD